jgi:hypothetical protein
LVINIVLKDWFEFKRTIFILAGAMLLPLLLSGRSPDFAYGAMAGLGIGASYAIAHFCFTGERRHGTLRLLLSLPLRPSALVLAKYASVYSMVCFTTLVPILFVRDVRLAFLAGSFVLFLSTLCMSFTVVSDQPWAAVLPLWLLLIGFMLLRDRLTVLRFLGDHIVWWTFAALVFTPLIAVCSALWFEKKVID